jgi:hypothetical protein
MRCGGMWSGRKMVPRGRVANRSLPMPPDGQAWQIPLDLLGHNTGPVTVPATDDVVDEGDVLSLGRLSLTNGHGMESTERHFCRPVQRISKKLIVWSNCAQFSRSEI